MRLLRDSELYDPFTPNLLIDESINNTASYLAPKSQVFKRLKAMNTAMKNRQIMESHSLYVTQVHYFNIFFIFNFLDSVLYFL